MANQRDQAYLQLSAQVNCIYTYYLRKCFIFYYSQQASQPLDSLQQQLQYIANQRDQAYLQLSALVNCIHLLSQVLHYILLQPASQSAAGQFTATVTVYSQPEGSSLPPAISTSELYTPVISSAALYSITASKPVSSWTVYSNSYSI